MRRADLVTAFLLRCQDCGHQTLVQPDVIKSADIPRDELKPGMEEVLANDPDAEWFTCPDTVRCAMCEAEYTTRVDDATA